MSDLPRIGVVGIGLIGLPVASNLLSAGYSVAGYRRSPAPEFQAEGGQLLESAAAVTRASDIILVCLPGEEAQLQVMEGEQGILSALGPGKCVVELGTYSRAFKLDLAKRIEARGATALEAEISGSPVMVRQKTAAFYVGGAPEVYARCEPVLQAITQHRFLLGEYGSAVTMKLIANYLLTIHTLAAAEAVNLGSMAGFDPKLIASVISQGAGNSAMFSIRAPMMAERRFSPAAGPFLTLEKYLKLNEEMVGAIGAAAPLFSAALPYFKRAIQDGIGTEDIAAVIKLVEADSAAQQPTEIRKQK